MQEQQYLDLLQAILDDGVRKSDRTGTGTISLFGAQMRFNLMSGFPLLTTKKLHTRSILVELEWMLRGRTDTSYLNERGCTIWDEWAKDGELGPVYGKQWRSWEFWDTQRQEISSVDQIEGALALLKREPTSRRNVVTAWNPAENGDMALHPCHCLFQFNCRPLTLKQRILHGGIALVDPIPSELHEGGSFSYYALRGFDDPAAHAVLDGMLLPRYYVDLHMYQRSADVFLGVPFNIASYAMLLHIMTRCAGEAYAVGDFVHSFGDVHIYSNHEEQVREQLERVPRKAPTVALSLPVGSMPWDFTHDMVTVQGYDPYPAIKAEVSI